VSPAYQQPAKYYPPVHHATTYTPEAGALSFGRGEEEGFAWAFRQFYPSLVSYACRITGSEVVAEEIASEAFLKIWQRHEGFDHPLQIKAYLYRTVRNDALKEGLRGKREKEEKKGVAYLYDHRLEGNAFQRLIAGEVSRELNGAIEALPAGCARVVKLLYVEGKSLSESAEELNISINTVKTQRARGLKALRARLTNLFSGF
jgi:RNA polymerase sigma factor (sigma-70 family)